MNVGSNLIVIVFAAAVAVAMAGLAAFSLSNGGSSSPDSQGTLTVETYAENDDTSVMHFYIASSDGGNKTCVDEAGQYDIPSDPVFVIEVVDSGYAAKVVDGDVSVYTSSHDDGYADYQVNLGIDGVETGKPVADGGKITVPLTVGEDKEAVISDDIASEVFSITCYCPYNDGADYEIGYCDTHVLTVPAFSNMPAGKTVDYWTFHKDGSGPKVNTGDVLSYTSSVYAVLKDA